MKKPKKAKKDLKYYRALVKQLEGQINTLRELRGFDQNKINGLEKSLNSDKLTAPQNIIREVQLTMTANAHALEAIAKLAQPGIF